MAHVVCRPTRREAVDFYHYFAEELADTKGQAYHRQQRATKAGAGDTTMARPHENRFMREAGKKYEGTYPGIYPLIGTPDDIAGEMARMQSAGLAGCSVAFLDYLQEIPYFVVEILPRLERLGLRQSATGG